MAVRVLADGLGWPEGPVVDERAGTVVFVETFRSQLTRWSRDGSVARHALTGGGPNAVTRGRGGELYVTQNGGKVGPWRAADQRAPAIQRVAPDGEVSEVVTHASGRALRAPNDLAFGPDGALYFTDPGGSYDPVHRPDPGWICRADRAGGAEIIAETGHTYPNGIACDADGSIVWVESYTRDVWRLRDGKRDRVCHLPARSVPDGLAVSVDGDLFITATRAGGVDVVSRSGNRQGFIGVGQVPTNCAFDGADLLVTDGGDLGLSGQPVMAGRLLRVTGIGARGLPLFQGSVG